MSATQFLQSGAPMEFWQPQGAGKVVLTTGPTNGQSGFAPGCEWINMVSGARYINAGSTTSSVWIEQDATAANANVFGSSGLITTSSPVILASGYIYRNAYAAGQAPAATGADKVVDVFSLPANSLDGAAGTFRNLVITAGGLNAGTNNVTAKLIFNATTAVIGSTVSGGTTIATTGVTNTNVGWVIQGLVYKVGAKNANTQIYQELETIVGVTHGGCGLPAAITATENAAILIAVTLNCATAATDGLLWWWNVLASN